MERQHRLMDDLEPWRHLDEAALEAEIWKNIPENSRRWTDPKPHIASTTDTVVAFLSGKRPLIVTTPKRADRLSDTRNADFNERIGTALFDTIDRDRSVSLLAESAEYDIHRGAIVGRVLYLSPEERGEERETYTDETAPLPSQEGEEPYTLERVVGEPVFPLDVQLLDPRDCGYVLDAKDRVIEFIHCYTTSYAELCADFPHLYDQPEFKQYQTASMADTEIQVVDYWNKQVNAIICDGKFVKEPSEHGYRALPFVVELPKTRVVRDLTSKGTGLAGRRSYRVGTPFCYAMLPSIRKLSWADSVRNSYLEEVAVATLVLARANPQDSLYFKRNTDPASPNYGKTEFIFQPNLGPNGRVIPLTHDETLEYMKPPQAVEVFQERAATSQRDLALVSFPESILSGAQVADVSGYAYSQMKQAAIARIEPYRMALDRFWSRMMELMNTIIIDNWDYLGDDPMMLTMLGEKPGVSPDEPVGVTIDAFEAVGSIRVTIKPEIPINQEQEWGLYIQMYTVGLLSKLKVLDLTGVVQDPAAEIERAMFEKFSEGDPATAAAIVQQYMKRNHLDQMQPTPPPVPAAAMGAGIPAPQGAAPLPQSPLAGMTPPASAPMSGAALPGMPGPSPTSTSIQGGGPDVTGSAAPPIPPELIAQLLAARGGR